MTVYHYSTVSELLTSSTKEFQLVLKKTQELRTLQSILEAYLDPLLHPHCHVGGYREGELTLLAAAPTWATHIRYLIPDLLEALKKEPKFRQIHSIYCRVIPATARENPEPKTPPQPLSNNSRALLRSAAEGIQNRTLAEALQRLSRL